MKKLFLLSLLLFSAPAWATTYYVNKAGSNANSCATAQSPTDANAKLTINGATGGTSCLSSGDTLIIGDGTYVEQMGAGDGGGATAIPSGTSSAQTIIQAENRNLAIVAPNAPSSFYACEIKDKNYITIDGVVCDAANIQSYPYWIHADTGTAHHIILQNGTARNGTDDFSSGITYGIFSGSAATKLHSNQLLNMDIHDNGQGSGCIVQGCGVGFYNRGASSIFDGNRIHDNGAYCFQNDNASTSDASNNIYRNNTCYNNANGGIFIGNGDNNIVYNNIVYNNTAQDAIQIHRNNQGIYNNTIYNNEGHCVRVSSGSGHLVQNNICFGNDTDDVFQSGGTATASANILGTDPSFTNAGAADFTLTAGSTVAIDQGVTITPVATDFAGHARPVGSAYDIGAYEYDVPTTQSVTVTAPTVGSIQQRPDMVTTTWTVANISSGTMVLTYSFDSFVTSYPIASGVAWDGTPYLFAPTWPKHGTMKIRVCQAVCGDSPAFVTRGEYLK